MKFAVNLFVFAYKAPQDFSFSLYELDWNTFNTHLESMIHLVPKLSTTGIKTEVCGPESFTPDHQPIMGESLKEREVGKKAKQRKSYNSRSRLHLTGEDPRCSGLFYSCGYNSAGMMLGGGCGEQIARWMINGRPDKYMFNYDIRR